MKNRRSSEAVRQVPMIEQCSEPDNSQILIRRSPGKSDASRCGIATAAKAPRTPVGLLCRMQRLAIEVTLYPKRYNVRPAASGMQERRRNLDQRNRDLPSP